MPATSLNALEDTLTSYVPPEQTFLGMMNMVLPRLHDLGQWRDLVFEYGVTTANGYFTIPETAEAVLAATVEGAPSSLWAQWHDYVIGGIPGTYAAYPAFGVVDDGFNPTHDYLDLTVLGAVGFKLVVTPTGVATVLPPAGSITIDATDVDGNAVREVLALSEQASVTTTATDIASVEQILFTQVSAAVDVDAVSFDDAETLHAATGRGTHVARYRRYRCGQPEASAQRSLFLLLKRAFIPLTNDQDIVYLGNVNALKHGMLAVIAEDNADIDRAQYHWSICTGLLEAEKDNHRGGARQAIRVDPSGGGGQVVGMY